MTKNVQNRQLQKIMTKDEFLRIPKELIRIYGLEISGLIAYMYDWKYYLINKKKVCSDGWFYIEQNRIFENLKIIKKKQQTIFNKLDDIFTVKRHGKNNKNWYNINETELLNIIKDMSTSGNDLEHPVGTPPLHPYKLEQYNKNNITRLNSSKDELSDKSDNQPPNVVTIPEGKLEDIKIIFDKYINIVTDLKLIPGSFKLIKHKSIDTKVGINNHSESISIKELIFDALQTYDTGTLIKCLSNYKLICMDQTKYWYKSYWSNITILRSESLLKLLDIESLEINKLDCYSAARYNTKFLTLNDYDPKSPLNTETNTYMNIDTEILKKRDVKEYYNDIRLYIDSGEFEKNISYFQWVEECIVCLIFRKIDEDLLNKFVDIHNYWYRHFKLMLKTDK